MLAFTDPLTGPLRLTMLALVVLVGLVTTHYAAVALRGTSLRRRALAWFGATLAAALLVIAVDDLIVLALGWTAASLALHHLLTLIPQRTPALVGAHKKFVVSRIADVAIAAAVVLTARTLHTTSITELLARTAALPTLPWTLELAAVLLVIAVALRSAQLPMHGWLLQVMEAPTPVSALLHAGVINLGAFVLILLGGLVGRSTVATTLLVLIGGVTAALAGLVMLTRADVKGALAWSTAAQMGFVLLEIGVGAYAIALLHIVAHALYKAHAFLDSGRLVRPRARVRAPRDGRAWLVGAVAAVVLVGGTIALSWGAVLETRAGVLSALVVVLSGVPLLARHASARGWRMLRLPVGGAIGIPLLYAAWHAVLHPLVPRTAITAVPLATAVLVALGFTALLVVQGIILARPGSGFARWLYPHALHGFHLDDLLTRLTFRLWPPRRIAGLSPEPSLALPTMARAA